MKTTLKYYKPYIPFIIFAFICLIIQALLELQLPAYMAEIINEGIIKGNIDTIKRIGGMMLIVATILCSFAIGSSFFSAKVSAGVSKNIRKSIFAKVTEFSPAEIEKFSTSSLITRSTNDVQQIQGATVMILRMAALAPIMGAGALFKALNTNLKLSWTIGVTLVLVVILLTVIFKLTIPKFKLTQVIIDKVNLVVNERLSGNLVIRAFNTEIYEEERFDKTNKDYLKVNLFINRAMTFLLPAMVLIMNFSSVLIVWVGAKHIDMGNMLVGDILAFMQYSMMIIMAFIVISMMFIMVPKAMVSMKRIGEVLDTPISVKSKADPTSTSFNGDLEFKNVSFQYPNAADPVIENISFTAKAGKTTAFIGSTGSGKSTILKLIPRFFDPSKGEIFLDSNNIKELNLKDLRKAISYVPQKALLFSGTIYDNIGYGENNVNSVSIYAAAKTSQSLDFISAKDEGYNSLISQGGNNISGGQKQRLSIARALASDGQVLLFDDSFSALDFTTDKILRGELAKNYGDKNIIIVAQRINTIINADQIIVLDEGKVVGTGTHHELMNSCQVYREIAMSQLDPEKLEGGN